MENLRKSLLERKQTFKEEFERISKGLEQEGFFERAKNYSILERYSMIDFETTGLPENYSLRGAGVTEIGYGQYSYGKLIPGTEFHTYVNPEKSFSPTSKGKMLEAHKANPVLAEMQPHDYLDTIFTQGISEEEAGKNLLAHLSKQERAPMMGMNLKFESHFMTRLFGGKTYGETGSFEQAKREAASAMEKVGFVLPSEVKGASTRIFHPGGPLTQTAATDLRLAAFKQKFDWANKPEESQKAFDTLFEKQVGVYNAMKADLAQAKKVGAVLPADIQVISSTALAIGQKQGYLPKTGDFVTGTSVSTISRAIGIEESHLAFEDKMLQAGPVALTSTDIVETYLSGKEFVPRHKDIFSKWAPEIEKSTKRNILRSVREAAELAAQKKPFNPVLASVEPRTSDLRFMSAEGMSIPIGTAKYTYPEYGKQMFKFSDIAEHIKGRQINAANETLVANFASAFEPVLKKTGTVQAKLAKIGDLSRNFEAIIGAEDLGVHLAPALRSANWMTIALGAAAFAFGASIFSGRDDQYNSIEGLRDQGQAQEKRHQLTDFGSGWQGIDPSISAYRSMFVNTGIQSSFIDPLRPQPEPPMAFPDYASSPATRLGYQPEDIRQSKLKGLTAIDIDKFNYQFEDADTLVLKKKASLFGEQAMSIRIAGMDSPETGAHDEGLILGMLRFRQEQPFGKEASARANRLLESMQGAQVLVDTSRSTYGRYVGTVVSPSGNYTTRAVQEGLGAPLSFGAESEAFIDPDAIRRAGLMAQQANVGMWQEPFWQTYGAARSGMGHDVTFNTMTSIDRLAINDQNAQLTTLMWDSQSSGLFNASAARAMGQGMYHKFDNRPKPMYAPGFGYINAASTGAFANAKAQEEGDFGSPWHGIRGSGSLQYTSAKAIGSSSLRTSSGAGKIAIAKSKARSATSFRNAASFAGGLSKQMAHNPNAIMINHGKYGMPVINV